MGSGWFVFSGVLLFFIGVAILLLTFRLKLSSSAVNLALIISILSISVGSYLIFTFLPWYVIIKKLVGFLIFLFGYFLVFLFPGETDYQHPGFGMLGLLLGVVFLAVGVYLVIF